MILCCCGILRADCRNKSADLHANAVPICLKQSEANELRQEVGTHFVVTTWLRPWWRGVRNRQSQNLIDAIAGSGCTRKEQRVRRGAQARERAGVLRREGARGRGAPPHHEDRLGQLPRELGAGHHEAREGQGRARGGLRAHAGRAGLQRPARSRTTSRRSRASATWPSPTAGARSCPTWSARCTRGICLRGINSLWG